jgi:hypothetical protein
MLAKPVTPWICIQMVTGWSLSQDTGYPGMASSWFSSVQPGKFWGIITNYATSALLKFLPTLFFTRNSIIQVKTIAVTKNIVT